MISTSSHVKHTFGAADVQNSFASAIFKKVDAPCVVDIKTQSAKYLNNLIGFPILIL